MTATITPLQISKLIDSISRACGGLTPEVYSGYRFAPVKTNPLIVLPIGALGQHVIALLRHCAELKASGERLPRIVMIVPTSKMRRFMLAVEEFALTEDAHVVSRQENTEEEVENARTSDKAILIASPMFALGLNFEVQPEIFLAYFSYVSVDTSQIIQTLNRANRGDVPCEVRLYCGDLDPRPARIPDEAQEKLKIEGYLLDEATVQGVLETHFHINRVTYIALREAEKISSKSLYELIENNSIQNFTIQEDWSEWLTIEKNDHDLFIQLGKRASQSYEADIIVQATRYRDEPSPIQFYNLEKLSKEKNDFEDAANKRVTRVVEAEERGIIMALCGLKDVKDSEPIKNIRLRRLHGEAMPFLTAQYDRDRTDAWREALAEKSLLIIPLVTALQEMKDGTLSFDSFSARMNRSSLRYAFLALADSESDYLAMQELFGQLDKLVIERRFKAGSARRLEIKEIMQSEAVKLLARIGVGFGHQNVDGKDVPNTAQIIVPDWNFDEMSYKLRLNAKRYREIPETHINKYHVEMSWQSGSVNQELCNQCMFYSGLHECYLGRPVQWLEPDISTERECDKFKAISNPLQRSRSIVRGQVVGDRAQ